jgi:uncharacterized protein
LLAQLTLTQVALITGILVLAGLTKGVLGVGLPLVAVPLLAQVVPVPLAIMTLAVSTVVSNGFQAWQGGQLGSVFRRFWTVFAPLVVALFLGARLLVDLDERKLGVILGTVLIAFTLLSRFPKLFHVTVRHEKLMSPLVGVVSGLLGGVSSFYGPPLLMYLVALKLPKDFFISAVSTALFLGALPLIVSLIFYGAMGYQEFILSALSVIPVFAGLLVGQAIQKRMPQEAFRTGLLIILLLTGASLILRAVLQ